MQQETKRRKVVGTREPDKQFVDGEADDDDECSGSKRKSAVTATSSSTDVSSTKANVAVETNNNYREESVQFNEVTSSSRTEQTNVERTLFT